jgi:methylphosphotriester-DNA--protein-cysteine methyltransferase
MPPLCSATGAAALRERVAAAGPLRAAAVELERALLRWLPGAGDPDRVVEAAVADLARSPLARPVAGLADRLGVSARQLHRRCTAAVGYGPKLLHRVLRFRRFLSLAAADPTLDLAELAATVGYADQAHLTRDTQRLAGATPAALVRR